MSRASATAATAIHDATGRLRGLPAGVVVRAASAGGSTEAGELDGAERFAAYVAHELRTPLATQRVLLELALSDPDADLARWRAIAEDLLRACGQQQRLLEACLTLARSRRGLSRTRPVDLAAISNEVLRRHDLGALASVVALEQAWTTGDPDLLERLVANLLSNAIRHNRAGGEIELATRAESGRAVLRVANTGRPIPAGTLRRLFAPFVRLDPSRASCEDGVGLGLAIVLAIADAHGAALTACALPRGGLRIDVGFPAAAAAAAAS